jgi:hypothetical protein
VLARAHSKVSGRSAAYLGSSDKFDVMFFVKEASAHGRKWLKTATSRRVLDQDSPNLATVNGGRRRIRDSPRFRFNATTIGAADGNRK